MSKRKKLKKGPARKSVPTPPETQGRDIKDASIEELLAVHIDAVGQRDQLRAEITRLSQKAAGLDAFLAGVAVEAARRSTPAVVEKSQTKETAGDGRTKQDPG